LLHDDAHDAEQEQVEEREEAELEDRQDRFGHYEASKRSLVVPKEISSPSCRTASRTATPLTIVPFVEPRSAIRNPSRLERISACRREVRGSVSVTVQSALRPIVTGSSPSATRRPSARTSDPTWPPCPS